MRAALSMPQQEPDKHRFARELQLRCAPEVWREYFKFAFVRNPWDRLVSWWEMIRRNAGEGRPMNGFQHYVLSRARTFEEFILRCDEEYRDADGSKWIFRNQIDYVADDSGRLLVDFVGRFERLAEDFAAVCARLGLQTRDMPHLNRTQRRNYTEYYSPELADIVARRYARDLAAFDYAFGPPADLRRREVPLPGAVRV